MSGYPISNIENSVKLVVWDLDETFWKGTLSEGGATPIQKHIDMVRELVDRGIMCSICSKNDFETAKAELEKLGIWDLFIFPHIDWTPKGQAIRLMIDMMGLREVNVVFLDDNNMNLEEAQFFCPGIMCVDGTLDLAPMLELPQMKGKNDKEHSRLKQYKVIEERQVSMRDSVLSNEDFLRQSGIQIRIVKDIDDHMDRVLEILNRTNQLNFTKIRANTDEEKEALKDLLNVSGIHAGLVHVKDNFGDYGIVGFFCVRTKYTGSTVHHFAFSCRTLNMGVEQWVWEMLGCPEIEVAKPVANPVKTFDHVDWIKEVESFDDSDNAPDRRLCLVGGCDLLQVSFYCGNNRDEFVNTEDDGGYLVRYDDIGFFLNDRDELRHDRTLLKLPSWSHADMVRLDESLAQSDVLILSMYYSVPTDNLFTFGGKVFGGKHYVTMPVRTLKKLMKSDLALWFAKSFHHRRLELGDRIGLTERCFERAAALAKPEARIFVLSAAVSQGQQAERTAQIRAPYNDMCRNFCDRHDNALFVDIDALLDPEDFVDSDHYTRIGYHKIAKFVNEASDYARAVAAAE